MFTARSPLPRTPKPPDVDTDDEDGWAYTITERVGKDCGGDDRHEGEGEGGDEVGEPGAAIEEQQQLGDGGAEEELAINLPLPETMQGPPKRRRPPRDQWLIRFGPELPPGAPATKRARQAPDFLGVEQERDGDAAGLLDLPSPPTRVSRLTDLASVSGDGSLSPVSPPTSPTSTPVTTPETSPDTSSIAPPRPAEPPDVLQRHRHFSIGGGETEPDRNYPMIDWMPYPRPPPSS